MSSSTMPSPYHDKRSELFQRYFQVGLSYEDYVASGKLEHQLRWTEYAQPLALSQTDKERLRSFKRQMRVVVISGTWCGDCARQGPMLRLIELETSPLLRFRYLDNKSNPELQEELRINGAEKVPVVVVLSEDFFELSRFGDRHLSVYRLKALTELRPACDAGIILPGDSGQILRGQLAEELSEWVYFFERLQLMLRLAPALRKRYGD